MLIDNGVFEQIASPLFELCETRIEIGKRFFQFKYGKNQIKNKNNKGEIYSSIART